MVAVIPSLLWRSTFSPLSISILNGLAYGGKLFGLENADFVTLGAANHMKMSSFLLRRDSLCWWA